MKTPYTIQIDWIEYEKVLKEYGEERIESSFKEAFEDIKSAYFLRTNEKDKHPDLRANMFEVTGIFS